MKVSEKLQQDNCTLLYTAIESVVRIRDMNYYVGDVTVGRPYSGSDDGEYPLGNPPVAVCEITSQTNSNNDFEKVSNYASIGVEEYVIIHIHEGAYQNVKPYGIYVCTDLKFKNGRPTTYQSMQFVNAGMTDTKNFGQLDVETLRDPPRI